MSNATDTTADACCSSGHDDLDPHTFMVLRNARSLADFSGGLLAKYLAEAAPAARVTLKDYTTVYELAEPVPFLLGARPYAATKVRIVHQAHDDGRAADSSTSVQLYATPLNDAGAPETGLGDWVHARDASLADLFEVPTPMLIAEAGWVDDMAVTLAPPAFVAGSDGPDTQIYREATAFYGDSGRIDCEVLEADLGPAFEVHIHLADSDSSAALHIAQRIGDLLARLSRVGQA